MEFHDVIDLTKNWRPYMQSGVECEGALMNRLETGVGSKLRTSLNALSAVGQMRLSTDSERLVLSPEGISEAEQETSTEVGQMVSA